MTQVIAPFILLAVSVGLFFSYLRPAIDVLTAFQEQEARVDDAITKSERLKTRTQELMTQYAQYERDDVAIKRLETLLPDSLDPVRLIINLDTLAQKHHVEITSFDLPRTDRAATPPPAAAVQEGQPADGGSITDPVVSPALFRVDAHGQYADLKAFLMSVEQSLSLLDVTNITFASRDLSNGSDTEDIPPGQLSASFILTTYWLK